jgi:hypothetical protein
MDAGADRIAVVLHVAAGGVALATFWLPWLVRKGGALHRRVGWVYTWAMAVVSVTGLFACALRLTDAAPANDAGAAFLGAVGLLAGASASAGVRVIRTKGRRQGSRHPWDLGVAAALGVAGAGTLALAARHTSVLFGVFGVLSIAVAAGQLRFWLRPPQSRAAYLFEHIGAMGGSCIATVTAFVVVNAERLGMQNHAVVLWIAPGVLGGLGISLWQAHYRRRYARRRSATVTPSTPA